MTSYEAAHDDFSAVVNENSEMQQLATGMGFTEGPVWLPSQNAVIFTDIPANALMKWSESDGLSVHHDNSHFAIGLYADADERIIACEHTTRRLTRYERDGNITTLAAYHGNHILNSTNDVVVRESDGAIFFTDPPFGVRAENGELHGYQQGMEYGGCNVFKVTDDPHAPQVVTSEIYRPNGLCFNRDESALYVSDSSADYHQVYKLTMNDDDTATNPEVFAVMPEGVPDGMRIDTEDRLYVAGLDGVYVYAPDSTYLGKLLVPEMVTNICFGGEDRNMLFITATTSLYGIELATTGNQKP
ncbi:MAG: SMP-30/gluconolactonase/LRE family protein [Chloroflexota bacterium]